jgi:hypothetical protein
MIHTPTVKAVTNVRTAVSQVCVRIAENVVLIYAKIAANAKAAVKQYSARNVKNAGLIYVKSVNPAKNAVIVR